MGWTGIVRREHSREGLRYPSDMTEREWLLTAPFIPPAKTGGRRRTTDMREVVNALLYIASSGGAWRIEPRRVCRRVFGLSHAAIADVLIMA